MFNAGLDFARKGLEDTHKSFLTGMSRNGAGSILKEFVERGVVEKRGRSVATRYFGVIEKTT